MYNLARREPDRTCDFLNTSTQPCYRPKHPQWTPRPAPPPAPAHSKSEPDVTVASKKPVAEKKRWDVWDPSAPSFTYETLGCLLRSNVYPGWTYNYDRGALSHDDYNSDVFARRHHMTDKYRKQKDEMTMWAELDVKGQAVNKNWLAAFGPTGYKRRTASP